MIQPLGAACRPWLKPDRGGAYRGAEAPRFHGSARLSGSSAQSEHALQPCHANPDKFRALGASGPVFSVVGPDRRLLNSSTFLARLKHVPFSNSPLIDLPAHPA